MRHAHALALALVAASASAASCGRAPIVPRKPPPPPDPATARAVGAAWLLTKALPGEALPSVAPKVTADFTGPPPTHDFWSSLIWSWDGKQPYSQPLFAHPLAMQAEAGGLGVGYPSTPVVTASTYFYPYARDLLVGLDGLSAPDTRVAAAGDWTVTAAWADAAGGLFATLGHGLPYVYFRRADGDRRPAVVSTSADAEVFVHDGEALGLSVGGHHYGLFAPSGTPWKAEGARRFTAAAAAGKPHFAVAVLPDATPATFAAFRRHAYAHVTGSRVSWAYDEATATLRTRFEVAVDQVEPAGAARAAVPLLALYRHQWRHLDTTSADAAARPTPFRYVSPRGELQVVAGAAFATAMPFHGIVPMLPVLEGAPRGRLRALVDDVYHEADLFPPGAEHKRDVYWDGKALGRITTVTLLADQLGDERLRDQLLLALENHLGDWFDGRAPRAFYYDATWSSIVGFPSAYFSGAQLNDHHFHHGYYVMAAAAIAQHDPAWAARERYGEMVELLIRDAANPDRDDPRFPFLRCFDAYAGHSWANGPALFAEGNNHESSSEAINFAAATFLWGAATGNRELRDLGIYLYVTEVESTEQYWFDADDAVYPAGFEPGVLGMVWSSGGKHDTWWDPNPIYVHGINWLPFTPASLYLGRRPGLAARTWAELVRENRGEPLQWRDLAWMYLAFSDPKRALELLKGTRWFTPENGNSVAWLTHFIHTLALTGPPDATVTADAPTATVLARDGTRTYVAWNPGDAPLTVRFSDGFTLDVPARRLAHSQRRSSP